MALALARPSPISRESRRRSLAALSIALPIALVHAPLLLTSHHVYAFDYFAQHRPLASVVQEEYRSTGRVPKWIPFQYAGMPALGNVEMNLYYPPNWLFLRLHPDMAYKILFFLHMLLAAWGSYRLVRFLGIGRVGGAISAIAYGLSLSGVARMYAGHLPLYVPQAHAPLLLFLLFRSVQAPSLLRTALLGLETAAVLLGSNPQFVYHLIFLSFAGCCWRIAIRMRRRESIFPAAAAVVSAALLGAGIASVHLLPSLEVLPLSTRGAGEFAVANARGDLPELQVLLPGHIVSLGIPWFPKTGILEAWSSSRDEWHEKVLYIGVFPLILAVLALVRPKRPGAVAFFGSVGLIALLDALARHLPVHSVLSQLPLYGHFREPARSVWVTVLCLCVLGGFGWDAFASRRLRGPGLRWVLAGILAIFLATAALMTFRYRMIGGGLIFASLSAASLVPLLLGRVPPFSAAAAVLLSAADLCFFAHTSLWTVPDDRYVRAPWYARHVGGEREQYRVLDLVDPGAKPMTHHLRILNGYGYPIPKPIVETYKKAWADYETDGFHLGQGKNIAEPEILRRLNVRWIVSRGPSLVPTWREVARQGDQVLYEDPEARPSAFFPEAPGGMEVRRPNLDTIEVRVASRQARRLVVSEMWMPGWQATIDGRKTPLQVAEGGLISVEVPPGESDLRLTYDPAIRRIGEGICVSSLVLVALMFTLSIFRRPRRV